jgi:O-antigen ligase
MDRGLLETWCERAILLVVTATLLVGPLAFGGVRPREFAILQTLVALGLGLWALRTWLNPGYRLQWPPVCWFVAAFMVYAVVRYFQADVEYVARLELIRVLVYGWLFFLVLNNLHRQQSVQVLLATLLAVGTVISLYALYQFLTGSPTVLGLPKPEVFRGRSSGTFICPNHLAGYLEMVLPLALAYLILSRGGAVARIFTGYAAAMMFVGIGVSVSRGGYLATAMSLSLFIGVLLRYRGFRRYALAGLAVMLVAAAVFFVKAKEPQKRFRLMFVDHQTHNALVRADLWGPTFRMWRDHPWVGVGPAHFDLRFPKYRPASLQSRPFWSHNDYLNTLADWGLVGGLCLAGAGVSLAWGGLLTWRFVRRDKPGLTSKPSDRAASVLGLSTGLLAISLHSFVDFNLQIPSNAMLAVTLAGLLSSHLRFASSRFWLNPRLGGRVFLSVLATLSVVWLLQQAWVRWHEARYVRQADAAREPAAQVAALEQAVRIEPANAETRSRLGEIFRQRSWIGDSDWRPAAETAWEWFRGAIDRNPWDTFPQLHGGMTLDWLGRHDEAAGLFARVVELDPNNHYVALVRGWHEMQSGNWLAAKEWLERSLTILPWGNWLAHRYLNAVKRHLATP